MRYYIDGDFVYRIPGGWPVACVIYAETGEIIDIIPLP